MKKLIIACLMLFAFTVSVNADSKKVDEPSKKEVKSTVKKSWNNSKKDWAKKKKDWKEAKKDWIKKKKGKKDSIPIDGGLSLFLLSAGAIGISALRKK